MESQYDAEEECLQLTRDALAAMGNAPIARAIQGLSCAIGSIAITVAQAKPEMAEDLVSLIQGLSNITVRNLRKLGTAGEA